MKNKRALGVIGGLVALGSYGVSGYCWYRAMNLPGDVQTTTNAFLASETLIKDTFMSDPQAASQEALELLKNVDSRVRGNEYSYLIQNFGDVASGHVKIEKEVRPVVRGSIEEKLSSQREQASERFSELYRSYLGLANRLFIWGGGLGFGLAYAYLRGQKRT